MAKQHVTFDLLDPDKLIKFNDLQEITNPIFFIRDGVPTPDGLLSNEIFGISKDQRANTFAYADLTQWFINPLVYKLWGRMDSNIKNIVHGTAKYVINSKGELIKDENGKTGIKFLKDNIDKIKIRSTDSLKRDTNIDFIMKNKDKIFINKFIIIPAHFRDVNSSGGMLGVGEINKLYDSLLIAVKALRETAEYGLSLSGASQGRVQEIILQIYNWFTSEPNIPKKYGIVRRSVLSKTADYASRLVLSAPELKVEKMEDMYVDLDHSAIPLSSLCVNFYPHVLFWLRRFFEDTFAGQAFYTGIDINNKETKVELKDTLIEFSDAKLKEEIDRYIHGYSNRFIPVQVPNVANKKVYIPFHGTQGHKDSEIAAQIDRKMTWCDLLFMACSSVTKDKHVLITRYPMENYMCQFPNKIRVSSTKKTVPMTVNGIYYTNYPYIGVNDIGMNTSNTFIDTLNMSNLSIGIIGGDYKFHCSL